jgi:putative transcriptional regulator
MAIKVQIDAMLKERGWPIRRLSLATGCTEAAIWRLVRNKNRQYHVRTLEAICKVLDCQPGDFLKYEKDQLELPLQLPSAEENIDSEKVQA